MFGPGLWWSRILRAQLRARLMIAASFRTRPLIAALTALRHYIKARVLRAYLMASLPSHRNYRASTIQPVPSDLGAGS